MDVLLSAHIAGGLIALPAGAVAAAARKGGRLHVRAGAVFVAAMLFLGVSATLLDLAEGKPGLGGFFTCYFVLTSWGAARRRDGTSRRLEMAACGIAFATALVVGWAAVNGTAPPTPVGMGPVYVIAILCLAAGLLDLRVILRGPLSPAQRRARHLWRMCVAFFIATGSFFLGQQDVMPQAVRGSPALLVLAFAPLALMAWHLARLRDGKRLAV